ncbi:MarR family winged helix-turn-helix transcriptional regulator [Ureibacillus chungkukjangi]|uniref:MarR family transcriptional regulator n=1 Tax=Ureibacillus chungkukjangi TaxID=1202712 RepID=A0A318TQZ3_9BACL|nr:MarR family transcriptional regulator [Ureibacillus chungkukjangi]PYF07241.1 MarR family transcriptional regulator [Ureibacillus chungkukjangi]
MNIKISEQEELLFLLKTLSNQLGPKFERSTNLSLSRFELLYQLIQYSEISQSNLQKIVNIDHAAITRHLKQLESDGLVSRRRNPADNRETIVQLTEEGYKQIMSCQKDKLSFANQMFQQFSDVELQSLMVMLKRIQENIK